MGLFSRKPRQPQQANLPTGDDAVRAYVQRGAGSFDYARQQGRTLSPGLKWVCLRCKITFSRRKESEPEWWTLKDGPHVCKDCGSYAHTVPCNW